MFSYCFLYECCYSFMTICNSWTYWWEIWPKSIFYFIQLDHPSSDLYWFLSVMWLICVFRPVFAAMNASFLLSCSSVCGPCSCPDPTRPDIHFIPLQNTSGSSCAYSRLIYLSVLLSVLHVLYLTFSTSPLTVSVWLPRWSVVQLWGTESSPKPHLISQWAFWRKASYVACFQSPGHCNTPNPLERSNLCLKQTNPTTFLFCV